MNQQTHGILITLEGLDGSGKSTVAAALAHALNQKGLPVILTKEPGATELGALVRMIVQEKQVALCPESEFLLFAADRAQHFAQIIVPSLKQGKVVISDRMADSSLAYQGFGRGLDLHVIKMVNQWTMKGIQPDLTLYLRLPPEVALQRVAKRKQQLTSFEQEKLQFFDRVYQGFEQLFAQKENGIIIDAQLALDQVIHTTLTTVEKWLRLHNRT